MNKTKIDWATMSWNPVTGCRHGCPYCYARRTATRFNAGLEDPAPLTDGLHVLPEKIKATPYPYGFEPTLHRYRLGQPQNTKEPQTVFVCSMADLFGRWVPTSWIVEVLDACRKAPQHRYLFLTKNPARYLELDNLALLPHESNFWYGSTVANMDAVGMYVMQGVNINSFWSMEPLLGPVDMAAAEGLPEWWEKILDGEKTLEIRKTHPQNERLEWPVTVLVYVSGTGAVQGQFLCPGEVSYRTMQDLEEMSCVPREDLLKYAKGRRLSGWIVQSPEKFDAPSPLAEFGLDRPPMSWQYVEIPDAAEE